MMKRWKQLLSGTLAAAMLLCGAPTVHADNTGTLTESATIQVPLYQTGASSAVTAANYRAADKAAIEKTIYDGLTNCEATINLEQYAIPTSEFMGYFQNVLNSSPELFYVNNRISYQHYQGIVISIIPNYTVTGAELVQQRAAYHAKMKEILDFVEPGWTDLEKVVFLHDYLAQNYVYKIDQTTDANGIVTNDNSIYDAYGFLTEGNGVCQAYTLVYLGLLKEVGINTAVASSSVMNHIWNLVQLDGKWYHVDVTWDDPVPDNFGNAYHNYLLLSDSAIQQRGHYGWVADYECTDTTYDSPDYFWRQFSTPFKQLQGTWYTAGYSKDHNSGYLYSIDFGQKSVTPIHSLGLWHMSDNSYTLASYSGLSTYGNKLYFNTESSIMSYDPSKTREDAIETVFTPSSDKSVCGMIIQGSTLTYRLMALSISGNQVITSGEEFQTYDLPELPPEPVNPLTPGDMDGDGHITLTDAFIVLKTIVGAYTMSDAQKAAADVDGTPGIALNDVQIILRWALRIDPINN